MLPILSTTLGFSALAALLMGWIGRRDRARDPRLTRILLAATLLLPLLHALPGFRLLPSLPASSSPETSSLPLGGILLAVWLAGVALGGIRLVRSLLCLIRWRRSSRPFPLSIPSLYEVRSSPLVPGPVATGILRPLILLPAGASSWSPSTLETVLRHESRHLDRRDPLWRTIAAITCTLHWFNPLVWWMAGRFSDQCEFACDASVVADGVAARTYAHALCDVATAAPTPAATLAMAQEKQLEARIRRLLQSPQPLPTSTLTACALAAAGLAVFLGILRRHDPPEQPSIPVSEIRLRITADPFPGS